MNDPRPAVDPAACAVATSAPETPRTYSLELVAELTGITIHQVLAYQEDGLVLPVAGPAGMGGYDDDAVRTLRRLEHLRVHYVPHPAGLRLLDHLLDEVERLREELRRRRP